MTLRNFYGLRANVYEHPFDSRALKSLQKMPGLSLVFKKINEYGIDRLFRFRCTANAIRITYRNFPAIYSAFESACTTLAVDPMPDLYLIHGEGYIRTLTIGVNDSIVIINMDALERLTEAEWLYVFGHELGHIKSQHMLYHQTAIILPVLGKFIASSTLGLGGIATNGVELALYQWMMMAKLTCDRAGLLACQDTTVATRALMKLAGLPEQYISQAVIDEFLDQAREFGECDLDNLDKMTKILSFSENMRPWIILRTAELLKWIEGGTYESIVAGTYLFLDGDGSYTPPADGTVPDRAPLIPPPPSPPPAPALQPLNLGGNQGMVPGVAGGVAGGVAAVAEAWDGEDWSGGGAPGAAAPVATDAGTGDRLPRFQPEGDRPDVDRPRDFTGGDRPDSARPDPDQPSQRGQGRRRWNPEQFGRGLSGGSKGDRLPRSYGVDGADAFHDDRRDGFTDDGSRDWDGDGLSPHLHPTANFGGDQSPPPGLRPLNLPSPPARKGQGSGDPSAYGSGVPLDRSQWTLGTGEDEPGDGDEDSDWNFLDTWKTS
ncbi:M48 family metallopeptidase [Prochlorothrix hollandica]|uniref:M48 family metallopeptidase n=1 Tax=Prochlorothrix hollandica TaxID=1223 RepID=UPI000379FAA1|nr:M48 family metallopeptidase [Prochlorothrix hollandica]